MAGERNEFIDFLKGIGIFLVVWGHAMVPRSPFLYAFHMPLFFAISGYLFREREFKDFFKSKVKHLLGPFVLFFVLSWLFQAGVYWLIGRGKPETLFDFGHVVWRFVLGDSDVVNNSPLWFLTCLFCLTIVFYWISRIQSKVAIVALSLLLAGIALVLEDLIGELPLKFHVTLTALPFFALGWWLYENSVSESRSTKIFASLAIPMMILGHYFMNNLNLEATGIKKVNMYANTIGYPFLFYTVGILGTLWFVLSCFWVYKVWKPDFITFLGKHSLILLVIHYPMINTIRVLLENHMDITTWYYGLTVGILVTGICAMAVVGWEKVKMLRIRNSGF